MLKGERADYGKEILATMSQHLGLSKAWDTSGLRIESEEMQAMNSEADDLGGING